MSHDTPDSLRVLDPEAQRRVLQQLLVIDWSSRTDNRRSPVTTTGGPTPEPHR